MGPKGPPLASTCEPARSITPGQCVSAWPTGPSPGAVIRLDDGEIFAEQTRCLDVLPDPICPHT